ncbi:tryptophan-rich sensory protein [Scytonema millei]|uniref:Tryptophan-rich sensory protein n=1 Tax=Scytonema millei VB511283 TaxID=1245923 RepID=A0A9X5I6M5_9CYAN|nr:tryptophan-rich sensory protein [Scytonema millei]NHC37768.1 tryptophan-rich sensory protein [Scytonema millei VB511283]
MKASTQGSGRGILLPLATLLAILATLSVNALSNFFPVRGLNIGEIANTILQGVQITPANYAFAIWGLIYLGLIAYGIYQMLPAQRQNSTLHQVNVLLIIACLAQIAWVYLFTLQLFWLSVIAMLAILIPLIGAYLQLEIGKRVSRKFKWLVHVPFSIYLGWISVATIVNIASALYISNWDGWGVSPVGWTVIMLLIGAAIASVVALQRADIAFTLVFIWAYVAIAVRHLYLNNSAISITAVVAAIVLAVLLGFSRVKSKERGARSEG